MKITPVLNKLIIVQPAASLCVTHCDLTLKILLTLLAGLTHLHWDRKAHTRSAGLVPGAAELLSTVGMLQISKHQVLVQSRQS